MFRGALLLVLWAGSRSPPVVPQEAPTVLGEASPASILAGSFWNLTLLVDHPVPEEVEVLLPPLPRGLSLDRTRTESRILPADRSVEEGDARRWTALQYRFLARTSGRIDLPPLQVTVGGASVQSSSFSVTVRNPAPRPEPLRLAWREPPQALTVGEEALLVLRVTGSNVPELPAEGFPLPPVPPMVIMESLPGRGEGEVLVLRIIPLEGPLFLLPSFPLSLGTGTLGSPALRIPVNPPSPPVPEAPAPEISAPEIPGPEISGTESPPAEDAGTPPPFPARPVKAGGRGVQERSRALWEEGRTLEALAELRRNERDHPAGFTLVQQRRDLERALGLGQTADEIFRPRILLIPALALCLILAALGLTVPGILPRASGRRGRSPAVAPVLNWIFRIAGLMFTLIALFCLLRLTMTLPRNSLSYRRTARQALVRDTAVYQVPEDTGTEIDRFREGQGILVYEIRGGWAYAESVEDQGAGWIRPGTYLIY